jgi:hypothetical protein
LEEPFTMEEIDTTTANLPSHKYHGSDGFSSDFMKKNASYSINRIFMSSVKHSSMKTSTLKAYKTLKLP